MENIHRDLYKLILEHISSPHTLVSLLATSNKILDMVYPVYHEMEHKCIREIEMTWNSLVPIASKNARYGPDRVKGWSTDSYESHQHETIICSVFPWTKHKLQVTYMYGPRDLDILAWYLNGVKAGYKYL